MYYQYETLADEYHFQEFLKDVFNKKFSVGSFEEYRTRGQAQYGVDVYSARQQVAVQAKKKDIGRTKNALVRELLRELQETVAMLKDFPHPVEQVYFATNTKKYAEIQDEAIKLSRFHGKDIIFYSWEDLQKDISLNPDIRIKYYPHYNHQLFSRNIVAIGRFSLANLFGREKELDVINGLLNQHKLLLLQAVGGCGKSTLAKMYYEIKGRDYHHLLWLNGVRNFKKDIASNQALLTGLRCEFEANDSLDKIYELILSALFTVPGKLLIVIDDIIGDDEQNLGAELYRWASRENTHILITSRESLEIDAQLQLTNLSYEDCKSLFTANCKKDVSEAALKELFDLLSYNPMIIELVAKTINATDHLDVPTVIDNFKKDQLGAPQLQTAIQHNSNGRPVYGKLYDFINAAFDFTDHTEQEWYLLTLLSVLPAGRLPLPELLDIFFVVPEERPKIVEAVSSLAKKGFLVRETDDIRTHQLVLDVVRMKNTHYFLYSWIFTPLINRLNKANATFSNEGHRLSFYAGHILSRLKGEKSESILQPLFLLKNNLLLTYRYLGLTDMATGLALELEDELDAVKAFNFGDSNLYPKVLHNIGMHYVHQGDLDKGENYVSKAIAESAEGDLVGKVNFYNVLFMINVRRGTLEKAFESSHNALELLRPTPIEETGHLMAMIFNNYAVLSLKYNQPRKAWEEIFMGLDLYSQSKSPDRNEGFKATYLMNGAYALSGLGEHGEAVKLAEAGVEVREKLGLSNDPGLLDCLEMAIEICEIAGDPEKQKVFIAKRDAIK
ncbi:hypothetical protein [Mucilaginibacter angelicae]